MKKEISQNDLFEIFKYDDGKLIWASKCHKRFIGKSAGFIETSGYVRTQISGFGRFYVHRLIYLMHHGFIPEQVDHIDGVRTNNKIENLRGSNSKTNQYNSKVSKSCISGMKGVSLKKYGSYISRIKVNGVSLYLGSFNNPDEAAHEYNKAAIRFFGEYARLNPIGVDYD